MTDILREMQKSKLKESTWTPFAYIMLTSLDRHSTSAEIPSLPTRFGNHMESSSEISIGLVSFLPARQKKWGCLDRVKRLLALRIQGIHVEKSPTVIAFKSRRLTSHYPPTRQQHIANILWESIYGMLSIGTGNNFNLSVSLWKRKNCTE